MDGGAIDDMIGVDTSSGGTELWISAGVDACLGAVLVARARDFATGLNTKPPFSGTS